MVVKNEERFLDLTEKNTGHPAKLASQIDNIAVAIVLVYMCT